MVRLPSNYFALTNQKVLAIERLLVNVKPRALDNCKRQTTRLG